MSIAQTNMIAKIAAVVAGLGLVAMSFVAAAPAKAATSTDLAAQIAALQAQLAALQAQAGATGSASASVTFTKDLTVGSTGSDVTALQNWLIGKGFTIAAGATGFFGAQTKAAVAAWQAANGITPAAGYFGPKSRAAVNASAGTTGSTGGSTTLTGGAGKLKNVETIGNIESDLKEGDSATSVIGFSAEAQDSDIAVQRLDVEFDIGGTGSASLSKYIDTVAVYQDGKKLASMSASDGDKNGRDWTFRFSDLNGVIKKGDSSNFYVEVTPVSSVGSSETGQTVTAKFNTDAIRAVDGEGVSETYTPTGTLTQDFTVSTATTGTATISAASDNPNDTTVKVDANNATTGVTLMAFNVRAKNQDITVNNLPVGINTTHAASSTVQTLKLMKGSTVLESKTLPSTAGTYAQVVFDNLNQSISKDSTQEYTVVADIKKVAAPFVTGDTISATTTGSDANFDVEDANGNTVTPGGAATGGTMTLQTTGITVSKIDASYVKNTGTGSGVADSTQYTIKFSVTAGDDDLYIPATVTRATTASTSKITWATTTTSDAAKTDVGSANFSATDTNNSDVAGSYFFVPAGSTRTFTLNVTLTATTTSAGYTGVRLVGVGYGLTSSFGSAFTSGLDTFKTADVSMLVH